MTPEPRNPDAAPAGSLHAAPPWAAVFDVDGTMVDNAAFHEAAWIELGRRRGMPITREFYIARMHSRSNAEIGRLLLGPDADPAAIREIADEKEAIYRATYRPVLREIAGLTDLLRRLNDAGVPCAAVSNSPPANVAMVIDALAIRPLLSVVLDYTQVKAGKPDPELVLTAAARLRVPARRCLVLEDSVSGFAAAEAAGAPYVAVAAGADPAHLARAARAAATIRDFTTATVRRMAQWAGCGDWGVSPQKSDCAEEPRR